MPVSDPLRDRLSEAVAGDYALLQELGRGGMASVHLARDLALDRLVAIKVMAPELAAVPEMAERFLQEARIAAALSHPHIIPIHAVRRRGDLLYIVMRYVAGRPLDQVLRRAGPLPLPMVRAILTQVAAALDVAHRAGVVHRDIKPANILLDEQGDVVVADFGIARLGEQPGRTQAGQTVGTPEYMSPEQCAGETVSGATDQYALGVVAYELLTGAPPFTGEGLVQIVWRMLNEQIAPLAARRPDCAGQVAAAVHRMLERHASDRWPSVGEAVRAMGALALPENDPVRRALAALARGDASAVTAAATVVSSPQHAPAVTPPPRELAAALQLPLPGAVMCIDDAVGFVPEARDAAGAPLQGAALDWSSSDPAVARVDAEGTVTAIRAGSARVMVRSGEALAAMAIVVTRAAPRLLRITAPAEPLEVGDRITLALATGDTPGSLPHPRLAAWRSSDPTVCTVDATGRVHALAEGTVEIRASAGGVVATKALRVERARVSAVHLAVPAPRVAPGAQLRLAASPANTRGHPVPGLPVSWEVSNPAIAAITADGVLTARGRGHVMVAARVGGRVGTARVLVTDDC
ncbi:MAG: protein kinase [Gemmatimonadaceae bacterium]|nr:protein kinase [Gemmatimonadaceae bacterium]